MFRARTHSIKRRREEFENSDFDRRFDITKEFPPLVFPSRQGVDLDAASAALVGVMEKAPAIRALAEGGDDIDPDIKNVAAFGISVLTLLEAMWERVVRPLAAGPTGPAAAGFAPPPPPSREETDLKELKEVLVASEKTAILYGANLGSVPIANRQKLCQALSAGIRTAAVDTAAVRKTDPAEAVRVADDALSLVTDMAFLGQASSPPSREREPDAKYCTMPVKLEFEDRGARIHFERTIVARCRMRATMSLPHNVRVAQNNFLDSIRANYPGEIVMARVDTEKLRFNVFHKVDGGPRWNMGPEWEDIPHNILSIKVVRTGGRHSRRRRKWRGGRRCLPWCWRRHGRVDLPVRRVAPVGAADHIPVVF